MNSLRQNILHFFSNQPTNQICRHNSVLFPFPANSFSNKLRLHFASRVWWKFLIGGLYCYNISAINQTSSASNKLARKSVFFYWLNERVNVGWRQKIGIFSASIQSQRKSERWSPGLMNQTNNLNFILFPFPALESFFLNCAGNWSDAELQFFSKPN